MEFTPDTTSETVSVIMFDDISDVVFEDTSEDISDDVLLLVLFSESVALPSSPHEANASITVKDAKSIAIIFFIILLLSYMSSIDKYGAVILYLPSF